MPNYSGNYGKISVGSDDSAEVGSWSFELTGGGMELKEWGGVVEVDWESSEAIGGELGGAVTLSLYFGDDDSTEPYFVGQALIESVVFGEGGEAIGAPFKGTGPVYLVENGERQVL